MATTFRTQPGFSFHNIYWNFGVTSIHTQGGSGNANSVEAAWAASLATPGWNETDYPFVSFVDSGTVVDSLLETNVEDNGAGAPPPDPMPDPRYYALAASWKYKIGGYSSSLYLKGFWDEVIEEFSWATGYFHFVSTVSTTPKEAKITLPSVCPGDWDSPWNYDESKWPTSDEIIFPIVAPPIGKIYHYKLANFRVSALESWTPPTDQPTKFGAYPIDYD